MSLPNPNRLEPNLLLAISTGVALLLLVLTAITYGEVGQGIKYPIIAGLCVAGFLAGNRLLARRTNRVTPPMIHPGNAVTAILAGTFPLVLIVFAAVPVFWTGQDYGLLVIIGAVMTGVTIESAMKARAP